VWLVSSTSIRRVTRRTRYRATTQIQDRGHRVEPGSPSASLNMARGPQHARRKMSRAHHSRHRRRWRGGPGPPGGLR
jgi:hypothetical protein